MEYLKPYQEEKFMRQFRSRKHCSPYDYIYLADSGAVLFSEVIKLKSHYVAV